MTLRFFLCFLLAFVVSGKCQEKPPARSGPENSAQPESSVISIFACDANGKAISHATGFFISANGIIASTRHAIGKNTSKIVMQVENGRSLEIAGIIAEDPLHDLVLLQVSGNGFACLPLGSFARIHGNATVSMIIDPYMRRRKESGEILPLQERTRRVGGTIASVDNLEDDYEWFLVRMPVSKGESGSPILNEEGDVIGMIRGQLGNPGLCFAIPVDYIKQLLAPGVLSAPKPPTQLQKRDYDELFDDPDFKAGFHALNDARYKEGAKRMTAALKRFPGSGAFHMLLGKCLARQEAWSEAVREFNKAIVIKPDNALAWASLALALASQGKSTEAAGACEKAAAMKSELPETWFNAGAAYLLLSRPDDARGMLERLQALKTPEADEMAAKLTRAMEITDALKSPPK